MNLQLKCGSSWAWAPDRKGVQYNLLGVQKCMIVSINKLTFDLNSHVCVSTHTLYAWIFFHNLFETSEIWLLGSCEPEIRIAFLNLVFILHAK